MRWITRWIAVVVLACVVLVGNVRGDAAPGFLKDVDDQGSASLRFDNLADYPDFDFYLKYKWGQNARRLRSGEPIRPFESGGLRSRTAVFLLAVPQGQKHPAVIGNDRSSALPPGCFQSAPLDGTYAGTGYLVSYHVRIEDGKLEANVRGREWLAGEWSLWWLKRLPCILVPIAFSAVLGWLGVRIGNRLFPRKPPRSA